MNRKGFIKMLAAIPLLNIPFKTWANRAGLNAACKTQRDAEGPFYKEDAPLRSVIETEGIPLQITGKVLYGSDCQSPVANAVLDVWHCDNHGEYDMKGFKGRAQVKTDADGNYSFNTIYPPPYGNRPRHIHFKIRTKTLPELTTQLYFHGDPNIENDFARNAEGARVITLHSERDLKKGVFNIYL
jgi:protocatechuate 3,4-dioxygenase beta subunit